MNTSNIQEHIKISLISRGLKDIIEGIENISSNWIEIFGYDIKVRLIEENNQYKTYGAIYDDGEIVEDLGPIFINK